VHPYEISERTLKMVNKAVNNFKEGKASAPVDMDELKQLPE
jgi:hypothetical protein